VRISRDPAARRRLFALSALAATAAIVGVVVGSGTGGEGSGREEAGDRSAPSRPARGRPEQAVERLSLERQVGQLLVMSFDGFEAPQYVHRELRRGGATGVIVFGKNVASADGLRALTASLQRSARGGALVATDQEGGTIRSVSFAPPEQSQSALGTAAAAARSARTAAGGLRQVGINVNLAPVADVASPGSVVAGRAYPGGSAAVGPLVQASVRAHSRERVAATVKHFPGLGRARENTDDAPVTIDVPRAELESSDLAPFRAAIQADVPLVMTSHALYPAFDRAEIASQSPVLIERVLRRELGFRGVVVTDSIEADAVLARSGVAEAAERAVEAGTDLVLMTGSGSWREVYPRLLRRARSSASFRARLRESAAGVIALKRRLGLRPPR
jgi:beta-N-acetylhexosaminidase